MLDTLALIALENSLNRLLSRDPAWLSHLAPLHDKTLALSAESFSTVLIVSFHQESLSLTRTTRAELANSNASVSLDVSNKAIERLSAGDSIEALLFSGHLAASGDTSLLTPIQKLFLAADIDLEGLVAKGVGLDAAHLLSLMHKKLLQQASLVARESKLDWREYLFEEQRLLVGQDQLDIAKDYLRVIRQRLDRVEARVQRLKMQHQGLQQ